MNDEGTTMSKKVEKINENTIEEKMNYDYDRNMLVIDLVTEKMANKLEELINKDNLLSDDAIKASKILKNVTSAKKNILKADLLSIELDDTLYDEFEEDEDEELEPIEEIDEVEEFEEVPEDKKNKKNKK